MTNAEGVASRLSVSQAASVDDQRWLAERFVEHEPRLRSVARSLLGTTADADDAVQEAWLRLTRSEPEVVNNLGGWLTTVVSRIVGDAAVGLAVRHEA